MSHKQLHWTDWTGLSAAVVAAVAEVLHLLDFRGLHPFFELLRISVPLWLVLLIVIIAICLPGIVHRFWTAKPGLNAEQLKIRCNLTITGASRMEGRGPNQYTLSGAYEQWPPHGYSVWLITTDVGGGPKYWPQQEITRGASNEWHANVGLGQAKVVGERMIAILAIVGECSQILIDYYGKTKDTNNPERKLPLWELPGIIPCAERMLDKIIEK